jgi:DNA-binding LacI/PurR family transcriptional regulator
MRRFDAARETVRRALAELQAEGLVVRQVGKGTFPSKRARQVPGRIGLIVLSYAEIFAPICAEIGRLCRARGLELLFGDVSALDYTARAEQARRFARDFVAQRVSGVILQPIGFMENAAALNAEMRDLFAAANVPVVLLDSGWPDGPGAADVVGVDNFRCGQALGCHRLAARISACRKRPECDRIAARRTVRR